MKQGIIVAIDGPVASGKGTMARSVAKDLEGTYLDSGAMYRAFGLYILKKGEDPADEDHVNRALPEVTITLHEERVLLNGEDVSGSIRTPEVSSAAASVGKFPQVHELLMNTRRAIAKKECEEGKIVITEGRNEATVTFPDASLKIFLTADITTRAKRRYAQEQVRGNDLSLAEIEEQIRLRDKQDMEREHAPLVRNPEEFGYTILDDSHLSEEETKDAIKQIIKSKTL